MVTPVRRWSAVWGLIAVSVLVAGAGIARAEALRRCWCTPERWELKAGYGWQYTNSFRPTNLQVVWLLPSAVIPITESVNLLGAHGRFEWNPELLLATFQYPYVRPILGITPLQFRFMVDPVHRVQPYVLAGAGAVYANVNRIETASHANFNLQVGAGVRYPVTKSTDFLVEYRHVHVSNAGLDKPNHGLNTHNFYVGVSIKR